MSFLAQHEPSAGLAESTDSRNSGITPYYSMVVPMFNEADSVAELHAGLVRNLSRLGKEWEIIFIDDGSRDNTYQLLSQIAESDPHVWIVKLRRNFGQTAALAAGFDHARGQVILAMDGDLQHDPNEIPKFIEKIDEGFDVVSGWRQRRVDGFFMRRVPSAMANWLIRKISGVEIHDFGTTFKAYRRDIIEHLNLYGDAHRFIPALAAISGATITEVPIKNINAPYRRSNYGLGRTFRVMLDLITIKFLNSYLTRPLHLFGTIGLASLAGSVLIGIFLIIRKIRGQSILVEHGPLLILGVMLLMMSLVFFSTGLLAELIARVYFEAQHKPVYTVREIRRGNQTWPGNSSHVYLSPRGE
ncbi:MAG TPA: glycosyltransferase family 2 protein [Phycisphaerae bacterium]|nr:glycosyltransferase family 2 protein [Phycisphaerae bacterium]